MNRILYSVFSITVAVLFGQDRIDFEQAVIVILFAIVAVSSFVIVFDPGSIISLWRFPVAAMSISVFDAVLISIVPEFDVYVPVRSIA